MDLSPCAGLLILLDGFAVLLWSFRSEGCVAVDVESWRELMTRWNAELLDTPDALRHAPADVVASGWLGCPPASEEQIRAAEARICSRLPPSYRAFLQVSNGWRHLGHFHWKLWSADEIDWFRVRNQQWIDAYQEPAEGYDEVSEAEHRVYGPDQRDVDFRLAYLDSLLEVSERGDGVILLLNPEIVFEDGEWEAWDFGTWYPGAHRFQSFWDLMQELRSSFIRLRNNKADG